MKCRIPNCVRVGSHCCSHSMITAGMLAKLVSLFRTFSDNNNINHILPDILCELKESGQHFKA